MNDMVKYFTAQEKQARQKGAAILDKADEEGRQVSPDEKAEFDSLVKQAESYAEKAAQARDEKEMRQKVEGEAGISNLVKPVPTETNPGQYRTIGEAFVNSAAFKAIQTGLKAGTLTRGWTSTAVPVELRSEFQAKLGAKSAETPVLESNNTALFGTGGNAGVITTLLPGVSDPGFRFPRLTIADLIPSVPVTDGNSVTVRQVTARDQLSDSDATQVEGENKATIGYEFEPASAVLLTKAAITEMSTQLAEDDASIVAYINKDLPFQIRQVEERYLASVLYESQSDATPLDAGTTAFDEVLAAMLVVQEAGFDPNGMLITPRDWAELRASKFDAGDGHYVGGGPFSPTNNPWDLRVVVSAAATPGHPLVGDFGQGATVYRKGGLRMSSDSSGERFDKNLIAVRAEMRLVLWVEYPEAFIQAGLAS